MILQAILSLRPGAQWTLSGNSYGDLVWLDEEQTKPTQQEVENKVAELIADFEAKAYQRSREAEYPKLADQLDMLWHAIDTNSLNKTSDFYTAIKTVKDAYPKSGE